MTSQKIAFMKLHFIIQPYNGKMPVYFLSEESQTKAQILNNLLSCPSKEELQVEMGWGCLSDMSCFQSPGNSLNVNRPLGSTFRHSQVTTAASHLSFALCLNQYNHQWLLQGVYFVVSWLEGVNALCKMPTLYLELICSHSRIWMIRASAISKENSTLVASLGCTLSWWAPCKETAW